jgi:hypothetical protein
LYGIVAWYTSPLSGQSARRLLAALEAGGLKVVNPLTGRATSLDQEGEQVEIAPADLEAALASPSQSHTFQFWLDGSTDVVCRSRRLKRFVHHTFSLDGLTAEQAEVVIALVSAQVAAPGIETHAFLVDRTSSWEDVNYDKMVLSKIPRKLTLPSTLLIRRG